MKEDKQNKFQEAATWQGVPSSKQCPVCGLEVQAGVTSCPKDGTNLVEALQDEPEFKEKYEFLGTIGSGGMGVIYKARQTVLNKLVAIKMLHPHIVSGDAFRRFQIEGKAVGLLQHPYIINIHDLATTGSGQPYMVMDFVEGRTLAQIIEGDGPLGKNRFLRIFEQICDALAHAHNRGVLHRDLKPSNIMLTRRDGQEEVRIMDFGIAKLIDDAADQHGASQLTRTGETIGSPYYMSPEHIRGGKTDSRSDVYSLGCVMYEALTGAPPFTGSTPIETLMMHLNDKPLSLSQSVLGKYEFDPDLEAMIARLLEKNPDLRYQSMEELSSALSRFQAGEGLDRFVDASPAARVNWQVICIAAASVCVSLALIVVAYFLTKKSAPTPEVLRPPLVMPRLASVDVQSMIDERVRKQEFVLDLHNIAAFTEVHNADIAPLENATNANDINLKGATHIDDQGLQHIGKLKLESLNLTDTGVKDLHALKGMTTLTSLSLERTFLDDSGMKVIGHLTNLQELTINNTGISDEGLGYLSGLRRLTKLYYKDCSHLTKKALARLENKLPDCIFDPPIHRLSEKSTKVEEDPFLTQAKSLSDKHQYSASAAKYGEAVKELKGKLHPDLWLIARTLKSQGGDLISYGKSEMAVNLNEAHLTFTEALKCFEEAEQTLNKIEPADLANAKEKRKLLCETYVQQGWTLEDPGNVQQAIIVREKAIKLVNDHAHDDPAMVTDPHMVDNLTRAGIDWVRLSQDDRAAPLFREAMSRYEKMKQTDSLEYALAANNLGDIYGKRRQWKEALPLYECAVKITKAYPDSWKKNAHGLMWTAADTYVHLGRNQDAEHLLKELVEYEPNHPAAGQLLIQVLTAEHKKDEALYYTNKLQMLKAHQLSDHDPAIGTK